MVDGGGVGTGPLQMKPPPQHLPATGLFGHGSALQPVGSAISTLADTLLGISTLREAFTGEADGWGYVLKEWPAVVSPIAGF